MSTHPTTLLSAAQLLALIDTDTDPSIVDCSFDLADVQAGERSWREGHVPGSQHLHLDTQLGYLDAKYKEFADDRFPGGSRAFQTPAFAPKWTMRFGAQYAADLGSAGSITIGG